MRVLIIGGGIGGLCLAGGLVRGGVDVEVFERSPVRAVGMAGYGIHLNADGLQALHDSLPSDSWEELDAVANRASTMVHFWNEQLRVLSEFHADVAVAGNDPVTRRRGIGRIELRDVLLRNLTSAHGPDADGVDGVLRWGKEFVSYDRLPDGRVRANFADGTSAVGDLLIGADGANSRVRKQYLPHLRRVDLGVINIAGRFPLDSTNVARVPSEILDSSVNNVVPAGSGWMFLSTWGTPPEPGADGTAAADGNGSFIVWAYVGSRDSYPADIETMDHERLRELVLSRTEGWSPLLHELVRGSAADTIVPVVLKSMEQLPSWSSSNVTLLGDAIHNMTPMAGIGANTALRDAGVLRQSLVDVAAGRWDLVDAVEDYERQMRAYANVALAMSTRNALNAASDKRLARRAFRTMLRVAEAVPPVKHRMFPSSAPAVGSHRAG